MRKRVTKLKHPHTYYLDKIVKGTLKGKEKKEYWDYIFTRKEDGFL